MNRVKHMRQMIAAAILSLIFIACAVGAYIYQLNRAVADTTIENMKELSLHDIKSIQNYLNMSWETLDGITERLSLSNYKTIEAVQEHLKAEKASCSFDTLYLLDESGNAYYDTFRIMNADDFALQRFEESDYFVVRGDLRTNTPVEAQRENLVYGSRIYDLEIDGITFVGLIAQRKINSIQNYLKIDSFGERGYSSVIDSDGNYIVNIDRRTSNAIQDNFFTRLEMGTILGNMTLEKVKEKIANNEGLSFSYVTKSDEERVMTVIPMDNTDWLFLMAVSKSVFQEQSQKIMWISCAMLAVVLLIIILMVILLIRAEVSSIRAKSETQARSEFLSNMSHEIRTPLNGLIGLNYLMGVNMDDKEKLSEYIEKSGSTAQYLLSLVNDILDMTKLQSGHFDLEKVPFSMEEMLKDVWSMQRENMNNREISYEKKSELKADYIVGDQLRIKQVLMNILSNAAKFTSKGGRIRLTAIQKSAEPGKVNTVIQITDNGIGISKEFQKQIFNSFSQERNKNSESQKGTGLGMSISYLLMKQMGGSIRVESEVGKGSTFTIEFPAMIAVQVPGEKKPEPVKPGSGLTGRQKVLLAEDNELNAEILTEILYEEGFQITRARDGQEAVTIFEESKTGEYDVILMDIQMPVMNGYEATRKIRSLGREDSDSILIYACTANAFKEDQEKAFESGMNDFLPKPVDVKLLLEKMEKCYQAGL